MWGGSGLNQRLNRDAYLETIHPNTTQAVGSDSIRVQFKQVSSLSQVAKGCEKDSVDMEASPSSKADMEYCIFDDHPAPLGILPMK